jgi:hypothetical protein
MKLSMQQDEKFLLALSQVLTINILYYMQKRVLSNCGLISTKHFTLTAFVCLFWFALFCVIVIHN